MKKRLTVTLVFMMLMFMVSATIVSAKPKDKSLPIVTANLVVIKNPLTVTGYYTCTNIPDNTQYQIRYTFNNKPPLIFPIIIVTSLSNSGSFPLTEELVDGVNIFEVELFDSNGNIVSTDSDSYNLNFKSIH
ncbi:MAG: hypothetical protein K0M69_06275 [Youngiibacter sp.]|nr:hypothetical protein [Youngiibacter sp.]